MTTPQTTEPTFRPAASRGHTQIGWLDSRHSFSFGGYHDPQNMGYRSLRVINDDRVTPGAGFGEHPHRDMEILTWVLDGALRHGDSIGNMRDLRPGELQAMTAGRGIVHSEYNASDSEPVHFLQIWIEPAERGVKPRYDQRAYAPEDRHNRWDVLASGRGGGGLPIDQDAELRVADLESGTTLSVALDADRYGYLHVATGIVQIAGQTMSAGDAFTVDGPGEWPLEATEDAQVLWFDLA